MNTTQYKIIKKITNQKYILPILKNVRVRGNLAFARNSEMAYFTELGEIGQAGQIELNGVYDLESLKLGGPLRVNEYDAFPEIKEEEYRLRIHTNTEMIKKLLCAVSKDKTRRSLMNIALVNPDNPYLVACDGYVFSFEPVKVEGSFDESIILSSEFMKLAVDLVGKGDIVIEVGENMCQLRTDNSRLVGELIPLQYPDVAGLIEKFSKREYKQFFELDSSILLKKHFVNLLDGELLTLDVDEFNKFIDVNIKYDVGDKPVDITTGKFTIVCPLANNNDKFIFSCDLLRRLKMKKMRIYHCYDESLNVVAIEKIK